MSAPAHTLRSWIAHLHETGRVEVTRDGIDLRFEAASVNFAMAYGFAPFPELIFNLALCHMAMNQNDKALRFLREFLNTDPGEEERKEAEALIERLTKGK